MATGSVSGSVALSEGKVTGKNAISELKKLGYFNTNLHSNEAKLVRPQRINRERIRRMERVLVQPTALQTLQHKRSQQSMIVQNFIWAY